VEWTSEHNRKPLILRGARQVGKTWLVRELARTRFDHLLEVNFDRFPQKADLVTADIESTLRYLSADAGVPITDKTLVFFDEVQAAPNVLHALRYFYELRPDLHVIAAGSLLDFVLEDHDFSMPVGRVSAYHLGPMSFEEFLAAHGERGLVDLLAETGIDALPASIHARLLEWLRRFVVVGGLPSVVRASVEGAADRAARLEQEDLLQTYRDDFNKYLRSVDVALLRRMFDRLPAQIGRKVKYVNLDREVSSAKVSLHLRQLRLARLAFAVEHTAGNGLPLGAEADPSVFKLLHLDIGLLSAQLGVREIAPFEEMAWVNEGQLAKQFIGQHLLYRRSGRIAPQLHCWLRQAKSSNAEVDYLIDASTEPLPIEVKAGTGGSLKSLHVFCRTKRTPRAVRFYTGLPHVERISASVPVPGTQAHDFELISLPLYLVGQLDRLLASI